MVLSDVMEDLEEQNIDFDRKIEIGMMAEVPATVILLDRFVEEVDFSAQKWFFSSIIQNCVFGDPLGHFYGTLPT